MIYEFNNYKPVIHESSFIHPLSAITGNVIIGKDCYIGPGAALRGDWGQIIIEDGCNVQENCTIHMFPGVTVLLKQGSHIGHGAISPGKLKAPSFINRFQKKCLKAGRSVSHLKRSPIIFLYRLKNINLLASNFPILKILLPSIRIFVT